MRLRCVCMGYEDPSTMLSVIKLKGHRLSHEAPGTSGFTGPGPGRLSNLPPDTFTLTTSARRLDMNPCPIRC